MNKPCRIFLVAVEPSGDALGADLMNALATRFGTDVQIAGVGGRKMEALGLTSAIDISELAILGLLDGLKSYGTILKRVDETVEAALAFNADAVVLIDSWGFMIRVAQRLQRQESPPLLVKYVGPQIWAARPRRANVLARSVDHLLTIHAFDAPMFEAAGLPTTFVGNPALERPVTGDAAAFRKRHAIAPACPVIGVLFGSRLSELRRIGPVIRDAIVELASAYPDAVFVSPVAPSIAEGVDAAIRQDGRLPRIIQVGDDEKCDATSAMTVALAVSGTATTELALAGVPTVATYKLGWFSWLIYRFILFKAKYFSLVNIAADEELIIEHAQTDANGPTLAKAVSKLISEIERGESRGPRLLAAAQAMRGDGDANLRAATAIMDLTLNR